MAWSSGLGRGFAPPPAARAIVVPTATAATSPALRAPKRLVERLRTRPTMDPPGRGLPLSLGIASERALNRWAVGCAAWRLGRHRKRRPGDLRDGRARRGLEHRHLLRGRGDDAAGRVEDRLRGGRVGILENERAALVGAHPQLLLERNLAEQ